jgi:hypothetical protein
MTMNPHAIEDEAMARVAKQQLSRAPALQLVAEVMTELRRLSPSWWSPAVLRSFWPARARMGWLEKRADLRQSITSTLTGLSANVARSRSAALQAELIDAALDQGDISVDAFESAFDVNDMVVYGPAANMWQRFRAQLPSEDRPEVRALLTRVLSALLVERDANNGQPKRAVLTALELRSAIDHNAWHTSLPLALRVAIDEARFRQERLRPSRPFHARHDLGIVGIDQLCEYLPLVELERVLDRAGDAIGFCDNEVVSESQDAGDSEAPLPLSPVSLVAARMSA